MPSNWPPPEILEASKREGWDPDYLRKLPERLDALDTDLIFEDDLVFLPGRYSEARSALSDLRGSIEWLLFDEGLRQNKPRAMTMDEKRADAKLAIEQQEKKREARVDRPHHDTD
jgi:hypothetical protein